MPNNRHRAIKRYTNSRCKRRLRSFWRRKILGGFRYPQNIADMANNVAENGLKIEPPTALIMISPSDKSHLSDAIDKMYARAKEDGYKHVVIPVDSPGGYIGKLPEGDAVPCPYGGFIEAQNIALREFLLTGKLPEIKLLDGNHTERRLHYNEGQRDD